MATKWNSEDEKKKKTDPSMYVYICVPTNTKEKIPDHLVCVTAFREKNMHCCTFSHHREAINAIHTHTHRQI